MISLSVWLPGPMFLPGVSVQEGLCPRRSLSRSVSIQKCLCPGGLCPGGLCPWGSLSMEVSAGRPPIRKAGGTHPIGMLSCFYFIPMPNVFL